MTCPINKIDSNVTGLAFAEEVCLKTLPTTPIWYELEPNGYSDIGGEVTTVARAPIDPSRQRKKGTVTDLDASGGFNSDFTQSNLTRLMQGFFFADARVKTSTSPMNGATLPITSLISSGPTAVIYQSGIEGIFTEGALLKLAGMSNSVNNTLCTFSLTGIDEITLTKVGDSFISETPPTTAFAEQVGARVSGAEINVTSNVVTISNSSTNFNDSDLTVGEWVFIGGDNYSFVNNTGYARISAISATELTFSEVTWTPLAETATGDIDIFFGTVLRNEEDPSLIKRRSYNIERSLGQDDDGTQSEYLEGAIANEFTLNIPVTDKLNADLSFVAMDNSHRDGATGVKSGTRVSAPAEDAYNTSSDIYRLRLNIDDPTSSTADALFAYVSEGSVAINNNVTPNKAIGTIGSFDSTAGNFEVSGSMTAYFSTVEAVAAVRNNADVQFNIIAAQQNAGVVFDIPLLSLGGGRLNVEKDSPITIPLESNGAENEDGYTLMACFFTYLPDVAMPA